MDAYHTPALLRESIEGLAVKPGGKYADVTFGGGGHSREILKKLKGGRLIAFDKDDDAKRNLIDDNKFLFVQHSFVYLKKFLKYHGMLPLDGILADLGISSWQIDNPERGFSTRQDESPLDMNMGKGSGLTARKILNSYSAVDLQNMFSRYGEIMNSRKLAEAIVLHRSKMPIRTTGELKEAIKSCVFREAENRYHAQVFQALRIEVNNEIAELKELLHQSVQVLSPGGRLAVISYHSLEDRLVKNFIAKGKFEGEQEKDVFGNKLGAGFRAVNRKPITATEEELRRNPRARSAKLRIAEKI